MDVLNLIVSDERPVATALIPGSVRYFYMHGHRLRTVEFYVSCVCVVHVFRFNMCWFLIQHVL